MNEEAGFQAALDANPDDFQTRLAFADWLRERDDPRADGYQVMGELRLWPLPCDEISPPWVIGKEGNDDGMDDEWSEEHRSILLPGSWLWHIPRAHHHDCDLKPVGVLSAVPWWRYRSSRCELEDTIATAFQLMPADERTAILARRYEG